MRVLLWVLLTVLIAGAAGVGVWLARDPGPGDEPIAPRAPLPPAVESEDIQRTYAGTQACIPCHEDQYLLWKDSHHALAERDVSAALDGDAFTPPREVVHGSLTSSVRRGDDAFEFETVGPSGQAEVFSAARAIGVAPLVQYLVPAEGGRYQTMALSYDPAKNEWFDVFGDEDRRPDEWGHWSNRGMNWNSMCAACHLTNLRKGYDIATDSYETTWTELGVGCEGCHGPYAEHAQWYAEHKSTEPWPHRPTRTPDAILDTCGSCHARRVELTEGFVPGDAFTDHYRPVLPDEPAIYYPDGQVLGENYEYISFLSSRMHGEGVRCLNCHEPHAGKPRKKGNALCLSCHQGKIDPAAHSHHDVTQAGGQCVNCHMPLTTYMQRHPRRDHGFTIPDPLLTKELGIPNACNRCHTDETVDWAIEATDKWYGERMNRGTRERARTVAKGQLGDASAIAALVQMADRERSPVWRAVAASLLRPWIMEPSVAAAFSRWLSHPDPLLRAAAIRAYDVFPDAADRVRHLLKDESRLVRIEAAWAQRARLDLSSPAGTELLAYLDQVADQPTGALQRGMFYLDRGEQQSAEEWLAKAVRWDPHSPPLRHSRAVVLSSGQKLRDAISELEKARELEPDNPQHSFSLGLAHAELGDRAQTIAALETAVALDEEFARAWYNLGLARIEEDDIGRGLGDLERAAEADPSHPEYPYAIATVLLRRGEIAEAAEAARRALRIAPDYRPALDLLQSIEVSNARRSALAAQGRRDAATGVLRLSRLTAVAVGLSEASSTCRR